MGSSVEEPNKSIDATVGGLVWVRRRNGSWWPGKIVGPEELPEGCVPTPRSGTPVKLLGREDASVDWYNLEKSKRVKAFHCGEYDECIKKVKESASQLSKKAAKYARREDAILHALELEHARLGQDHPNLSAVPESPSASHPSEDVDDDSDSALKVSKCNLTFDHVDCSRESSKQWRTRNDSEDDVYEGGKRTRGLDDVGMSVASSVKRKRSQVAHVERLKRKHRHRPLKKVMACATMVPVPVMSEISISCLESNESRKSDSVVINDKSGCNGVAYENRTLLHALPKCQQTDDESSSVLQDPDNGSFQKLFDVPLIAEEQHSAGFGSVVSDAQLAHVGTRANSSQSSCVEAVPLAYEEHNGAGPTSSGDATIQEISHGNEKGSFEWRFKGKRNSRPRKVDNEAEMHGAGVDSKNRSQSPLFLGNRGYHGKSRSVAGVQGPIAEQQPLPQRLLPYRQSRFTVNPKYNDSGFSLRHHIAVSSLYDVNVEVRAGHRPQHVPYISLISKLTGGPVIGHPLTIEVVEDGFSDEIFSNSECHSSCSELDHKRKPRGRPPTKPRGAALLSKRTRKLSSLTGSHRLSQEQTRKPLVEKLKGPSIACVPLKIVFSRINAALTNSIRAAPRTADKGRMK